MKVVSVFVFAVALVASWYVVYAQMPVAETVHMGIQNDLKNIITEYVQKNLPEVKNLRFERMWTTTLKDNKVKASFMYSFEEPGTDGEPAVIEINGTAILNKVEETPEMATWNLDELRILDNKVNFTEPIQITAETATGDEPVPAPEEEKSTH